MNDRSDHHLLLDPTSLALATDLYQLTMMAGYWSSSKHEPATFELFVRRLPRDRAFLVAAGLEQALAYLKDLRFGPEAIDFLRKLPAFETVPDEFLDWLEGFRFDGDVEAVPEGTVVFENEPLIRVTAPLPAAQLVETFLLTTVNFQTLIASKAARIKLAARGKKVIDFGTRRAHGAQAALYAARAAWIAGLDGTSNVLAGKLLGIPVLGTAAHSYVMSFRREEEAFSTYLELFPKGALLVDTYDSIEGCRRAAEIGERRGSLGAVRLDSGDLSILSRECRAILDKAGLEETRIIASGDLNEEIISSLLEGGAPIDSFGVGTELVTSRDDPALGGVYKLVERIENGRAIPAMKLSLNKLTYPGKKQVYRMVDDHGEMLADVLELLSAGPPKHPPAGARAIPLLVPVMTGGRILPGAVSLEAARTRCAGQLASLPAPLRALHGFHDYAVEIGPALEEMTERLASERRPQSSERIIE